MALLKSLTIVSVITILSRLLGFARDTFIACIFGVGLETDAFFIAFKLPNLLRRIFAEGAFSQAFIPILSEYKDHHGIDATRIFISRIAGLLIIVLTLITLIGILAAKWIVIITAPGFSDTPEKYILTSNLLRITFPYIVFVSLIAMAGAILNSWNHFSIHAFTPIILNITIISFSLFAAQRFNPPVMALAWSVLIGGILQLAYILPYLKKIGMLIMPRLKCIIDTGILRVLKLMAQSIVGLSISQISLIMNTIFASFLVSGSVSWMYYADRLIEFPSSVIGVTIGTVLLPSLSASISRGNYTEYSQLIDGAMRLCCTLSLPSSIAIAILSKPLTVVLFQYGKFSAFDASMTQNALLAYSVGLIGLIMVKVLAPGFYSIHDIKSPVQIAIITLIITQLINLILVSKLKHAGLSLSISLGALLNAMLLYWQLRRKKLFQPQPGWRILLLRLILATLVMAAVLSWLLIIMPAWDHGNMFWRIMRLMLIVSAGIISYFTTLGIIGLRTHHIFSSIN